jgi:hypothetical protein
MSCVRLGREQIKIREPMFIEDNFRNIEMTIRGQTLVSFMRSGIAKRDTLETKLEFVFVVRSEKRET